MLALFALSSLAMTAGLLYMSANTPQVPNDYGGVPWTHETLLGGIFFFGGLIGMVVVAITMKPGPWESKAEEPEGPGLEERVQRLEGTVEALAWRSEHFRPED